MRKRELCIVIINIFEIKFYVYKLFLETASYALFTSMRCSLFCLLVFIRGPPKPFNLKIERRIKMDKRPIRRKFNDNPYTLESIEKKEIYIINFKDYKGELHSVLVDKKVFDVFDENEKYENARFFEYSKHLLHEELNEETVAAEYSIEDELINNLTIKELKNIIETLPKNQKRRIKKYYFEEKSLEEIAKEENCSKVAIKYTIDAAINNISKKFKK